ncbi:MAG: hypothetical protein Q9P01_11580 [Anaerolineae bacterium]|nr:hypothetical protein [Anaerolineae bacterium]MDQ7035444.1 hypothetical protein [Anaerolineae bacterium]
MKLRLTTFTIFMLAVITACNGGLPPTEILIEVTRVVTVIVTPDDSQSGPVPLEPSETPEATAEIAEVTPEATLDLTPSVTPTPDPFPSPVTGQIFVAEQVFQRGRMFWLRPIDQIWVLTSNAEGEQIWQIYEDNFEEGMPESNPDFAPTEPGLIQPVRGFGFLWRENPELREQLGWAIAEEVGYLANYEYHYGGTLDENNNFTQGSGYHIVEALSREVYRFNEGTWNWEIVEVEE